jgi:hypothetical protein
MDYKDKPTGTDRDPFIWLRYTTQFTTGGRTHSIEMGIPVPVGASAEMREQLIREAESGMEQLTRHVENRVTQMLQRNARSYEPATGSASAPTSRSPQPSPLQVGRPQNVGAQFTAPTQEESQATARETSQVSEAPQSRVPLTRQTIGANMPSTPGVPGDASGNMKLSQFMQFIRETWGLTPKQAMDMLNIKSLNGLNYREVLRQLQPLVESQTNNGSPSNQKPTMTGRSRPVEKPSGPGASSPSSPAQPPEGVRELKRAPQAPPVAPTATPNQKAGITSQSAGSTTPASPVSTSTRSAAPSPASSTASSTPLSGAARPAPASRVPTDDHGNNSQATPSPSPGTQSEQSTPSKAPIVPIRMVRDEPRRFKFDEEEDDDEEIELRIEDGDDNDSDKEQRLAMARIKLDELKEVRGASAANSARLIVLHNVLNSQIDDEQLQRLMQATWGVTSVKKLKVDQAEALISWAKEDYFVEEVGAVLDLLDEEEPYARSDW